MIQDNNQLSEDNNQLSKDFIIYKGDYESGNITKSYNNKFILSGYYYEEMIEPLKKCNPNEYVLCVGYKNTNTKDCADVQIGVTGSSKLLELSVKAAIRELAEEVGIIADEISMEMVLKTFKLNGFVLKSSNAEILTKKISEKKSFNKKIDLKSKVFILVTGDEQDMSKLLLQNRCKLPQKDNGYYFMIMRISKSIKLLEKMMKEKVNLQSMYHCNYENNEPILTKLNKLNKFTFGL